MQYKLVPGCVWRLWLQVLTLTPCALVPLMQSVRRISLARKNIAWSRFSRYCCGPATRSAGSSCVSQRRRQSRAITAEVWRCTDQQQTVVTTAADRHMACSSVAAHMIVSIGCLIQLAMADMTQQASAADVSHCGGSRQQGQLPAPSLGHSSGL